MHVHEILLPSPTEHELAGLRAGGTKDAPYRMGVGRDVPELQQRVDLASLPWSSGPDRVARSQIRVRSPGARSIRVAVTLESPPEDLRLGYGDGARRVTDIDASDIADRPLPTTPYWGPVVDGDTASIELSASAVPTRGSIRIVAVSHLQ